MPTAGRPLPHSPGHSEPKSSARLFWTKTSRAALRRGGDRCILLEVVHWQASYAPSLTTRRSRLGPGRAQLVERLAAFRVIGYRIRAPAGEHQVGIAVEIVGAKAGQHTDLILQRSRREICVPIFAVAGTGASWIISARVVIRPGIPSCRVKVAGADARAGRMPAATRTTATVSSSNSRFLFQAAT
ncbi:MAG TPA: hypothetical protein VE442_22660 [Jatrophihabitans sp.]|nr:hypothetical protein [Jatrophihabitans sp.]